MNIISSDLFSNAYIMQHPDFRVKDLPLKNIDYNELNQLIISANRELARYDGLIQSISNPEILLSSLTTSESVSSSRIEGTQTTFSEVVKYEISLKESNKKYADIQEVINYKKALLYAVEKIQEDNHLTLNLIKEIHAILLDWVRWANKDRWNFRTKQNWIWTLWSTPENCEYLPPAPEDVLKHLKNLEEYFEYEDYDPLVQIAIIHSQFESIHPFLDGNGRVWRLLIPLFLYSKWILSYPSFYMSEYFEYDKYSYVMALREVTHNLNWEWRIKYFLNAVIGQVHHNANRINSMQKLYESMKINVSEILSTPQYMKIIDFIFKKPIFTANEFIENTGVSRATGYKYLEILMKAWYLWLEQDSKVMTYNFKLLLEIIE